MRTIDWLAAARVQQPRFWAKVNKEGPTVLPELGPCWLWTGRADQDGYGQFHITSPVLPLKPRQKAVRAHRLAWELAHGEVTVAAVLLHRCDVRRCVNPGHLRPGTHADNVSDMMSKGRHRVVVTESRIFRGERNGGGGKLTSADVVEIVAARQRREPRQEVARRFGISESTVKLITSGRLWTHVTGPLLKNEGA